MTKSKKVKAEPPVKYERPGQPTKYRPEYCQMLIEHMKEGLSFESFGAIADVSKVTLYNWADEFPEFFNAKHRGTEYGRLYWEKIGRDNILSVSESQANVGSRSQSLNSTVYSMTMKNRFGWRDKLPEEVAQVNINVGSMSDQELLKIVEDYTKAKDEK